MSHTFNNDLFIDDFLKADLKDQRLSNRLHKIATKMAANPSAGISTQFECWSEVKACSRFLNNPNVTHKRIQTPHRSRVMEQITAMKGKTTLFLQDLSELDYSNLRDTKGLGQAGNKYGKGIQMHSCLAIMPNNKNPMILGLAHQVVWERKGKKSKGKPKIGEQFRADKESAVWSQTLRAIGRPPEACTFVTISDRGSDGEDFFFNVKKMRWESVSRIHHNRKIRVNDQEERALDWMRSLESAGTYDITMRMKNETKERTISLNLAYESKVTISSSKSNEESIEVSLIRCWNDEESIEWILCSTIIVNKLKEALEKVEWYACRWIIEEYHKCLKTGCRIELSQLGSSKALECLTGILGIIALLMLILRNVARNEEKIPAKEYVPKVPLKIVCSRFKLKPDDLTVYEFWRTVARMGGFLARKSDGEPGWQTLWRGWIRLLDMISGAHAFINV